MKIRIERFQDHFALSCLDVCPANSGACECHDDADFSLHNWLYARPFPYLIVSFENENRVCKPMVISIIQAVKRLSMPAYIVAETAAMHRWIGSQCCDQRVVACDSLEDAVQGLKELGLTPAIAEQLSLQPGMTWDTAETQRSRDATSQPVQPTYVSPADVKI